MCWYKIENGVLTVETEDLWNEVILTPESMWVYIRGTVFVGVSRDGARVREIPRHGEDDDAQGGTV